MEIKANVEGLALVATMETVGVLKDQLVKITGDATVDVAGSGDIPVGHVSVPAKDDTADNADVTVEFHRFRRLFKAKFVGGAIAAGAQVKCGAVSSGQSTVEALASGDRKLLAGIVWIGAAENAEGYVLGL